MFCICALGLSTSSVLVFLIDICESSIMGISGLKSNQKMIDEWVLWGWEGLVVLQRSEFGVV